MRLTPKQIERLKDDLTRAGAKWDGHVTGGSIAEQMVVVMELLDHVECEDGGPIQMWGEGYETETK